LVDRSALCTAYQVLGFDAAVDGDAIFRDLVLARNIEPTSKTDSLRVLAEAGVATVDYHTVTRHLPNFAKPAVHQRLSAACATRARLGPTSLVLYDVSTLHFETDTADGSANPGSPRSDAWSHRSPSGCSPNAAGLPLAVEAFEGNKGETATMLPVINAFKAAHNLSDVIVVADAGMISEANQVDLKAAGLSYVLGARIPFLPEWCANGGTSIPTRPLRMGWY
jgi:hypothetical protein